LSIHQVTAELMGGSTDPAGDFVGPIVTLGEVADAVVDAARIDNGDREIRVQEHAGYVRVEARGELVLRFATLGEMLGRHFSVNELERNMPGFSGLIRVDDQRVRFLATKLSTNAGVPNGEKSL
jgi:toluene monooxygenase system protein D